MNLEKLKETMLYNGYSYFDTEAFNNKSDKICYIPENAETIEDCYNYEKLEREVEVWATNNPDFLVEYNLSIRDLVVNLYCNIAWEFPSTWLEGIDYEQ